MVGSVVFLVLVGIVSAQTWTKVCPTCTGFPSQGRYGTHAASYNNTIIAWDGQAISGSKGIFLDDLMTFDTVSNTWTAITTSPRPPPTYGSSPNMHIINGKLWNYGGQLNGDQSDQLWAFDLASQKWTKMCPGACSGGRPTKRTGHTSASWGNYYYFWGGGATGGYKTDMWRYDTVKNTWKQMCTSCAAGPTASHSASSEVIGGMWFIFGGYTPSSKTYSNAVWVYDFEADKIMKINTDGAPPARDQAVSASYYTSMYIYGGSSPSGRLSDLWRFDAECNTWTKLCDSCPPGKRGNSWMKTINATLYTAWGYGGAPLADMWKLPVTPAPACTMTCVCMPAGASTRGDCGVPTCSTAGSTAKLSSFKTLGGSSSLASEFATWSWTNSTHAKSGDWTCWKA